LPEGLDDSTTLLWPICTCPLFEQITTALLSSNWGYKEWLWLYQIKQHLTACKDNVIVGAEFGIVGGLKRRDF
jgi:hypothetical protein